MRLFRRKKESEQRICPRCSQLVAEDEGLTCPLCGWDLRDAYQGPAHGAASEPQTSHDGRR